MSRSFTLLDSWLVVVKSDDVNLLKSYSVTLKSKIPNNSVAAATIFQEIRRKYVGNTWRYCCVKNFPQNFASWWFWDFKQGFWKSHSVSHTPTCVTLWSIDKVEKHYINADHADISPLLRFQNNNVNLCFGDWGISCWFMRLDLQILRHSSCLCEDSLFIYMVCLGSSESQPKEFHHSPYVTHVWNPLPLLFRPGKWLRRSHFHVWQQCSPLMQHLQFTTYFFGVYL